MMPPAPPPLDRLSPAARRLLAVSLLLPGPLLAWGLAVPWLSARQELQERLGSAVALEARAMRVAARAPVLEAERAALAAELNRAAGPARGASHALAGAELQRRLRDVAARHGATLRSLETLPEEGDGMVGLRAQLRLAPAALTALLAEIEGGGWGFVEVSALTVAAASGHVPPGEARPLEAQFTLRALRPVEQSRP